MMRLIPRAAVALAVLAAAGVFALRLHGAAPRPNVVVIVMDTTRADRCAFEGYGRPTTPRLSEFAKDAVVFRDAWSPANWTAPAHASLFTGLRPEHHGLHKGAHPFLGDGIETLASRLAGDGYATACFSNNAAVSDDFGLTRGFQKVEALYRDADRATPWARATHEMAAEWALEQSSAGRPFLLFVNDMETHLPYRPPPEVLERFLRDKPNAAELAMARDYGYPRFIAYDLGVEDLSPFELRLLRDHYDAEIATLDAEIGALLDRLKSAGVLDSTMIVVAGDHGENLGEHHLYEHVFCLYRTLLHVPLLVRLPGRFDGGRTVDDVARLEDLFPTILEVCGEPVPAGLDGVSLLHDLPGRVARAVQPPRSENRPRMQKLYGAVPMENLLRGIVSAYDGRFHFLRFSDGSEELYDVRTDPGEATNVAGAHPQDVRRLRAEVPEPEPPVPTDDGLSGK